MTYKQMIQDARSRGLGSENAMWASIDDVSGMLEILKEEHPQMYWHCMRKMYKTMFGPHYNEDFARYDVSHLEYSDQTGKKCRGEHWSREELMEALRGKNFPEGTTEWDIYVAYNVMYADLCRGFDGNQILTAAYLFFFDDEDAEEGKIWNYMY